MGFFYAPTFLWIPFFLSFFSFSFSFSFSFFFLHHPTLFRWKRALRFASPPFNLPHCCWMFSSPSHSAGWVIKLRSGLVWRRSSCDGEAPLQLLHLQLLYFAPTWGWKKLFLLPLYSTSRMQGSSIAFKPIPLRWVGVPYTRTKDPWNAVHGLLNTE